MFFVFVSSEASRSSSALATAPCTGCVVDLLCLPAKSLQVPAAKQACIQVQSTCVKPEPEPDRVHGMMLHASNSWMHLAQCGHGQALARQHVPQQGANHATVVQQARKCRLTAAGLSGSAAATDADQPGLLQSALAGVRSSTSNSKGQHTQRKAIWMAPLRDDEVWYLAYGSNMSPSVLTGRRRVRPEQSMPCYVPGYALSFAVQGFPWAEPGFATIRACSSSSNSSGGGGGYPASGSWRMRVCAGTTPCLHGVLHRVNRREWELIKSSEGVLGDDTTRVGYQVHCS
jgi:hypothetical protein